MLFVIHAIDKPDSLQLRRANTESHVAYLKSQSLKIIVAGPLLADDGETVIGSMLVVDAEDVSAARQFFENDPYNQAQLFSESRVSAWRKVSGWTEP